MSWSSWEMDEFGASINMAVFDGDADFALPDFDLFDEILELEVGNKEASTPNLWGKTVIPKTAHRKRKRAVPKSPLPLPVVPVAPTTATICTTSSEDNHDERNDILFRYIFGSPVKSIRCRSVDLFPRHFVNCVNSGDFHGLADLVNVNMDRCCEVLMSYSQAKMDGRYFVRFYQYLNSLYPDRIMGILHTEVAPSGKVVTDIQIRFTDCKRLYEAIARTITEPPFSSYFPPSRVSRSEVMRKKLRAELHSEQEHPALKTLLDSDQDLEVYANMKMVLTLDEDGQKIVEVQLLLDITTTHATEFSL